MRCEEFFLQFLRKMKLDMLADFYENHLEAMRYLIFGALTTLVNIVVYAFCAHVLLKNWTEAARLNVSNVLALVLAMAFAYGTNKVYVFQSKCETKGKLVREIALFIAGRGFTSVLDVALMNVLVDGLHLNDILMKILVNVLVIILNFVLSKVLIFRKKSNRRLEKN